MYVCGYVCMLLMAGQTAGPFGPKLSEVTAGTPGMVLGPPTPQWSEIVESQRKLKF